MEAKLKSLRVAELRELLQKASVPIPVKSNKSDLIAKVLASPAALQAFESRGSSAPAAKAKPQEALQGGQDDDLLAPPEEFDWGSASAPNGKPTSATEGKTAAPSKLSTSNTTVPSSEQRGATQYISSVKPSTTAASTATPGTVDDEMERRKKRAARFGVPLTEVKPKTVPNSAKTTSQGARPQAAENLAKLEARAARFGTSEVATADAPSAGQKRVRPSASVDQAEIERRKKRAERFSMGEMKA